MSRGSGGNPAGNPRFGRFESRRVLGNKDYFKMINRLPGCYPVVTTHSGKSHWHRNGTHHGPQSNPAAFHVSVVTLGTGSVDFTGRRLWIYLRGGYAWCVDVFIDRRLRGA